MQNIEIQMMTCTRATAVCRMQYIIACIHAFQHTRMVALKCTCARLNMNTKRTLLTIAQLRHSCEITAHTVPDN